MTKDPIILVHTLLISTLVLEKFIPEKFQKVVGVVGLASIIVALSV